MRAQSQDIVTPLRARCIPWSYFEPLGLCSVTFRDSISTSAGLKLSCNLDWNPIVDDGILMLP